MATIIIRAEPEILLPREQPRVSLSLVNDGPGRLVLPNPRAGLELPVYRIRGPEGPGGPQADDDMATHANLGGGVMSDHPALAEPKSLTIPAGGRWDGVVALGAVPPPVRPGTYSISAGFALPTGPITSNAAPFRVAAWSARDLHAGFGVNPRGTAGGKAALLSPTDGGALLYTFSFIERRPDLGEAMVSDAAPRKKLSAGAADAAVPVRDTTFGADLIGVVLWREGAEVVVLDDRDIAARIALPAAPAALVMPPLWPAGGPVEVLALAADRRAISLLRFPPSGTPSVAWTVPLPFTAMGAAAALGMKGRRAVALVGEATGGLVVAVMRFGASGPPAPPSQVRWPGWTPPPGMPPAAFIQSDGEIRVALIAQRSTGTHVLETVFAPDGTHRDGGATPFGAMSAPEVAGAVLYTGDGTGRLQRREALLSLGNGALQVLRNGGPAYTNAADGVPNQPMIIVPGRQSGYLLRISPVQGPIIGRF